MMKIKNLLFIGLLIFLFVEILIIFPNQLERQEENAEKVAAAEQNQEQSQGGQKMQGVHLVESQSGARDWELFSESATGSQAEGTWQLKKVRVLFYNKEKVEFTVTGDTGTIDQKLKDINIVGNVVTRSENGYSFKTPSIFYSSKSREIRSPQEVLMQGPRDKDGAGMFLKGSRMLVLVEKSKMLIQGTVTAKKPVQGGKTMEVSSDGAEFSGKNREAKFLGAVRMSYDNMKLEGPAASFLYGKNDLLSAVNISGGVKVSDVDKYATSESVNLDLLADKYVFKGRPKVIQNNDELSGEEIIFLEGGKKVKIERARAKMEKKE
jgi:LPS export ABC transporter protein LptC